MTHLFLFYHQSARIVSHSLAALLVISLLSGCRPPEQLLPTLMPLPVAPSVQPPVPTAATVQTTLPPPTATLPPASLTPRPSPLPVSEEPGTVQPIGSPVIVTANGTLTITLTGAQLNDSLTKRFATQPTTGYAGPPHAILGAGTVELTITLASGTPSAPLQTATLTLTLAALPTVSGTVLDVRAISLIKPDGISTLQIKPAQALLTATLESLVDQAVGVPAGSPLEFSYVAVSSDTLTMTVLLS
jgi:hypothetical protein